MKLAAPPRARGNRACGFQPPNLPRRVQAVHHRHLDVHQDGVVPPAARQRIDGLAAVVRTSDAAALHDNLRHLLVHQVVLDDQHAPAVASLLRQTRRSRDVRLNFPFLTSRRASKDDTAEILAEILAGISSRDWLSPLR